MTEKLEEAIQLLEDSREACLATLKEDEKTPFASLTGFLYEKDQAPKLGRLYVLLSDLAQHTRNIKKNPQASVLIAQSDASIPVHEKQRVSLQGNFSRVDEKKTQDLKTKYLKVFPGAEIFFSLADFRFYQMEIAEIYWIGGFGKTGRWK